MRRRNEASTTLLFFLTSGWDTHLPKYIVCQKLLFFCMCMCLFCVYVPTALCRKLCDRAQGAEGPLGAAVRQSCRVAVGKTATNPISYLDETGEDKIPMILYWLDPLDFEDVIERWIAIATQSIFIFKILKHQRGTTERQFEANMVSWWELWVLAWYLRLLCSTEPVATGDWWVCCLEKLRVPKVISPSLSLSLLFHPSPSPSDTVPSSSPSSTKASSILNCVAMVITFYTVESWDWMITVGKERFTEER